MTGRPIPARVAARRAGDPAILIASAERIRRDLQWSPQQQDLDIIVRSAWEWMRHAAGAPPAG